MLCVFRRYLLKRNRSECLFFSLTATEVGAHSLCTSSTADKGVRSRVVLISLGLSVASSKLRLGDSSYVLIKGALSIAGLLGKARYGVLFV